MIWTQKRAAGLFTAQLCPCQPLALIPVNGQKSRIGGEFRIEKKLGGHAAIFAWSDLILDRSRKLVGLQSPAACASRVGGDSDPNFENYDLFHAQSPDTGCGVHARSWRANRDVDVRC